MHVVCTTQQHSHYTQHWTLITSDCSTLKVRTNYCHHKHTTVYKDTPTLLHVVGCMRRALTRLNCGHHFSSVTLFALLLLFWFTHVLWTCVDMSTLTSEPGLSSVPGKSVNLFSPYYTAATVCFHPCQSVLRHCIAHTCSNGSSLPRIKDQ